MGKVLLGRPFAFTDLMRGFLHGNFSLNFEGSFQLELLDYISTIFLIDIYNVQTHMFGLNKYFSEVTDVS